jgi:hypothetical protein
VLWLSRPPYLRWAAAGILVLVAAIIELGPTATVSHPYTKRPMEAGAIITSSDVTWRDIPVGLLPSVDPTGSLLVALPAGAPVLPGMLGSGPAVPPGWWALPLPLSATVHPGVELRVVLVPTLEGQAPVSVPGILVDVGEADAFGDPKALVAVPEEMAAATAAAASTDRVIVLVGSDG